MSSTTERALPAQRQGRREVVVGFSAEELKAPFLLRTGAMLIDYIVMVSVPVVGLLLGRLVDGDAATGPAGVFGSAAWVIAALIALTNFVILPVFSGQTIGKMLTGLQIVGQNGTPVRVRSILLRHSVGYVVTILTGGIGYLIAAVTDSGRALHDYIAGTSVVYARKRINK